MPHSVLLSLKTLAFRRALPFCIAVLAMCSGMPAHSLTCHVRTLQMTTHLNMLKDFHHHNFETLPSSDLVDFYLDGEQCCTSTHALRFPRDSLIAFGRYSRLASGTLCPVFTSSVFALPGTHVYRLVGPEHMPFEEPFISGWKNKVFSFWDGMNVWVTRVLPSAVSDYNFAM